MQMLISQGVLLLTILLNLVLVFILSRNNGYAKTTNQILLVHILGIIGWAFFILLNITLPQYTGIWEYQSQSLGYKFEKLIFAFSTIWLAANFWFVKLFSYKTLVTKPIDYFVLAFQFFILLLSLTDNVFYSSIEISQNGQAKLTMLPASVFFSIYLFFHLLSPIFILTSSLKRRNNLLKLAQTKTLLIIYLVFLVISVATNWILPVYFHIFTFNAFGPTLSLILVFGIFYTIFKHHFLNIRLVLQRGLIYTFLLAGIVLFYLSLLHFLAFLFKSEAVVLSAIVTTILGIFSVPYIDLYLRRKTDHLFFKDKYNYAEALFELSEIVAGKLLLFEIVHQTEVGLKKLFKNEGVHLYIQSKNDKTRSKSNQVIDFATPTIYIDYKDELIGSIHLHKKLSGDLYTKEDISLLKTFANQVAVSIENARLFFELEKYSEQLEQRVRERTGEIERLQAQQHQMLLDISHNLQNPLTIVKGRLGTIANKIHAKDDFYLFEQSIDEISKFIYELLHLSRLETIEKLDHKNFSLTKLLSEQIEFYEIVAEESSITIKSDIDKNIYVYGDKEKFKLVLGNLISNAIKYTNREKSNGVILIDLKNTGKEITLLISDNGIGIPEDEIEYVFDKFYRSTNGKKHMKGTGLGLAFVKTLIEKHNGSIGVKSTLGIGSTFVITLPITSTSVQD